MFSFSIDKDAVDTRKTQLASHDISEDRELAERLRVSGDYREDQAYYRAENAQADSLEEAVEYVHGIFFRAPNRIWFRDEVHEVTDELLARTEKPSAPK